MLPSAQASFSLTPVRAAPSLFPGFTLLASLHAAPRRPHFENESRLISQGFVLIAGLDEVGRGTLAGPVVAGAAILPVSAFLPGAPASSALRQVVDGEAPSVLDRPGHGQPALPGRSGFAGRGRGSAAQGWTGLVRDSKQLAPGQRAEAYGHLVEHCLAYATGACSAAEIDRLGIVAATRLAMSRAIEMLDPQPGHLLIDALNLPGCKTPQTAIIKGDAISLSIAAASIIAKVTRDRLMETVFEAMYPGYGFAEHKGYGTAEHLAALWRLGPSPDHRQSFAPVRDVLEARRTGRTPPPARKAADDAPARREGVGGPAR